MTRFRQERGSCHCDEIGMEILKWKLIGKNAAAMSTAESAEFDVTLLPGGDILLDGGE